MAKATARVVRFHKLGGPEVLQIDELPLPKPGKGEIRLKVKAIGLNRAEVMFRMGQYLEPPRFPAKNGYEASGVVDAVGLDVEKSWLGRKVSTIPAFSLNQYGVYGDTAIVPVHAIAAYPEKLTTPCKWTNARPIARVFSCTPVVDLRHGTCLALTRPSCVLLMA